ncbi:serine/threonine-protein phosphatase 7 long form homolog [Silene latifolia]|uniref:serine/threonine-protein phosphatase 7 long form homolog n=1 Tax=Silene latifolia TaxID=37657 RepID=UPI003D7858FC
MVMNVETNFMLQLAEKLLSRWVVLVLVREKFLCLLEMIFYEGGEFEQFQKELADEMRNYEGSENEEEEDEEVGNEVMENEVMDNEVPGNQEAGNVEAGNVEATSGLRVRRGIHGRFEVYGEGSSTSIPEPRRKVRARGKDTSWILRGPAPGGPVVPKLIPSFGGHISYLLWSQPQLQRLLTKYTRERSLAELRSWKLSAAAWKIVEDSGISHLPNIMHKHLNMPLLCAFIERWQPDTNTFHMPWGEMTILLHDVQEILGIEIDGFPCSIPDADMAHPILGVSELLGMTEAELGSQWGPDKDAKIYKGNLILQKALKALVEGDKRGKASEAQGYLMLLLSSTLFVDKSSDRVRANTFPMLRDVGSISGIAWAFRPMATLTAPRVHLELCCGPLAVPQREAGELWFPIVSRLDMMPIETVGHSLIQTFSHYDNVEDPAVTAEVTNFLRNVHPRMRA